jgi:hypothetical protein
MVGIESNLAWRYTRSVTATRLKADILDLDLARAARLRRSLKGLLDHGAGRVGVMHANRDRRVTLWVTTIRIWSSLKDFELITP